VVRMKLPSCSAASWDTLIAFVAKYCRFPAQTAGARGKNYEHQCRSPLLTLILTISELKDQSGRPR
jgi:hypothetical protein